MVGAIVITIKQNKKINPLNRNKFELHPFQVVDYSY